MMYNLYRFFQSFILSFRFSALCCIVFYCLSTITIAQPNDTFLNKMQQNFTNRKEDPLCAHAQVVWEAATQGYALRQNQRDSEARTVFVQIQAELERKMIEELLSQKGAKAVWIIHTPLIATPVVTEGAISPGLVSASVLADKDQTRVINSLDRAHLIRRFLAAGGTLIIAFSADHREGKEGRTKEQIAIYEKLKKQYFKQLIEFPIASTHFPQGNYPLDKIGATYFLQTAQGTFEATNRGLQINDARDNATWGLWLQDRQNPNPHVIKRLSEVMGFLEQAGLSDVITQHFAAFNMLPEETMGIFSRYVPQTKSNWKEYNARKPSD